MTHLADEIESLIGAGVHDGLFTGAAAGVHTAEERVVVVAGRHGLEDPTPVTTGSLFDLASLSKTYVAATIVGLIADGTIDPDAPVAEAVPIGSGPGSETITMRMLLTHTSGLPSDSFLWKDPTVPADERLGRILGTALQSLPRETFRYSCLGYIAAGAVAERITGRSLPDLVRAKVTDPLQLTRTGYGPVDSHLAPATEDESFLGRGIVQGEVHDELNWYLGGQVGNAGIFAPVDEVLDFAASFLDDTLLGPEGWQLTTSPDLPSPPGAPFPHSLGMRIDDAGFLGSVRAVGHTGFTGTMWWADPQHGLAVTLLTNRVHPDRSLHDIAPFRVKFSETVARVTTE